MTTFRRNRDGRAPWLLTSALFAVLTIAGCTAADPLSNWPRRRDVPLPSQPWPATAEQRPLAGGDSPLRAGSTVLHSPSGNEAQVAAVSPPENAHIPPATRTAGPGSPTAEDMAATLEALRVTELDPAQQQRLFDLMKRTEPSAWPELVRRHGQPLAASEIKPQAASAQLASHIVPLESARPASKPAAGPAEAAGAGDASMPRDAGSALVPAGGPTIVEPSSASQASSPPPPGQSPEPQGAPQVLLPETAAALAGLDEAVERLRRQAPLACKNLAFCTEVTSFGVYRPFAERELSPGQEVLLYAEIENFVSEQQGDGFHTELESSYEIVDSGGKRVDSRNFGATEDVCRQARRDFFIRYQFAFPAGIGPGTYTLRLSIQDKLGRKSGQGAIEVVVK